MLRSIVLLFCCVLFSLSPLVAASSSAPHPDLNFTAALPAVDSSIVIRQNFIQLNKKIRNDEKNQTIHLDLFAGVSLDVFFNTLSRTSAGSLVRQGKIIGYPDSSVLVIIDDDRVSGEITFSNTLYHIRTLDNGLSIAREINKAVTSVQAGKKIVTGVTDDVITLTNQERAKYGLPTLAYNGQLSQSAQRHADDMVRNNYYSHNSQDGRTQYDRIRATGYNYNSAAENIGRGASSATIAVNDRIASPKHHKNILSTNVCDIGVGYAYSSTVAFNHYWVQDFGRKQGVSTCPSAQALPAKKRPEVTTGTATKIDNNSMALTGTVNPNGLATEYYLEIGYTADYGVTSPRYSAGAGSKPISIEHSSSGFLPDRTYHYRVVAYNSMGVTSRSI